MTTWPIETCPSAVLPLLIEARSKLQDLSAPQAIGIANRIDRALVQLIEVSAAVEVYVSKWCEEEMEGLVNRIHEATQPWWDC